MLSRLQPQRKINVAARERTISVNTAAEIGKIADVVSQAYQDGELSKDVWLNGKDHPFLRNRIIDSDMERKRICDELLRVTGGDDLMTCEVSVTIDDGCDDWRARPAPLSYSVVVGVKFVD